MSAGVSVLIKFVALVALAEVVHADDARPPANVYRANVALADKEGARHAIVTSKLTCSTPAKCPEWTLDLGPADAASVLVLVDLFGKPAHVRYANDAAASLVLPGDAKLPAAFVRTEALDAANTRWERWTLLSLEDGRPKVIWRGELAMTREKGGGFMTLDGVELVAGEVGKPLALEFAQTSVPSPNEKARKPSAPLHRRFVMKDGTYQRDSSRDAR
jgi:hypothetical protein